MPQTLSEAIRATENPYSDDFYRRGFWSGLNAAAALAAEWEAEQAETVKAFDSAQRHIGNCHEKLNEQAATIKRLTAERDGYIAADTAEYDGAQAARRGVNIEDCPYGPNKPDGFRDSTLMGMWQKGHDLVTRAATIKRLEELYRAERAKHNFNEPDCLAETESNIQAAKGKP